MTDIDRLRSMVKDKAYMLALSSPDILDIDPINEIISNMNENFEKRGMHSKVREIKTDFVFSRENIKLDNSYRPAERFSLSHERQQFFSGSSRENDYLKDNSFKFPHQSLSSVNASAFSYSNPSIPYDDYFNNSDEDSD